jgi:hypothetical protein
MERQTADLETGKLTPGTARRQVAIGHRAGARACTREVETYTVAGLKP